MTGIFPFSYPVLLTVSSMILTAPPLIPYTHTVMKPTSLYASLGSDPYL
jgi:hypothetical protein